MSGVKVPVNGGIFLMARMITRNLHDEQILGYLRGCAAYRLPSITTVKGAMLLDSETAIVVLGRPYDRPFLFLRPNNCAPVIRLCHPIDEYRLLVARSPRCSVK